MSEFSNPRNLALVLMLAGLTSGCEPLENVIKATGANDSIGQMRQQSVVFQPATQDVPPAAVEPEPVYVPPPLGCEPHRQWRYKWLDCLDREIGTYGE